MSRYSKGTRVIAAKAIRRFWGDTVTKGSRGVVTEGGFLNRAQVQFTVDDMWGGTTVLVDVDDDEIAQA